MSYVFALACLVGMVALFLSYPRKKVLRVAAFQPAWRRYLLAKVPFYAGLPPERRAEFERRVLEFWAHCAISGIDVQVTDEDRLLVAAGAVIPLFAFPTWRYRGLDEVLLYPGTFNERFETAGDGRSILGQVGTGAMGRKMILSKPALHHGFDVRTDKENTAIHEFVHLIDGMDGTTDGLPEVLLQRPYAIPWMALVKREMERIHAGRSDIRPYGGVSEAEFLSVVSEYFFQRPDLLRAKHPELYAMLERMFAPPDTGTPIHASSLL
jgi:Mlc titration factor MtfA (ptsG expression regulator)